MGSFAGHFLTEGGQSECQNSKALLIDTQSLSEGGLLMVRRRGVDEVNLPLRQVVVLDAASRLFDFGRGAGQVGSIEKAISQFDGPSSLDEDVGVLEALVVEPVLLQRG